MMRWRRGSRGVEQAAEVPVHLCGDMSGSGCQAEDGPGHQGSVKSFVPPEHSSGVSLFGGPGCPDCLAD